MAEKINTDNRNVCKECESDYYADTSKMTNLCPECAHILYGYENCTHYFESGRCIHCFWDGSSSNYLKKLKDK